MIYFFVLKRLIEDVYIYKHRIYKNLHCIKETYRFSGYRDSFKYRSCYFYIRITKKYVHCSFAMVTLWFFLIIFWISKQHSPFIVNNMNIKLLSLEKNNMYAYILIYLIERHNKIRSPDSGESMCHNNSSSACPSPVQCCLHNTLTLIVQGGCRFVQQKNWRVFHEGTRNGNTLLLTARQLGTTLTNLYKLNILTEFNASIV